VDLARARDIITGQSHRTLIVPGMGFIPRPLAPVLLRGALDHLEHTHNVDVEVFGLGAAAYADLRQFSRDVMDIETNAKLIRAGLQATLWGRMVTTFNKADLDPLMLMFVARDGSSWRFGIDKPLICSRCGGTGSIGVISRYRCPEC
jgi:hypothetical protein